MSSSEKLIKRFLDEPEKITADECARLLEFLGYEEKKKSGSERTFHKKGSYPINVPTPKKSKYVKSPYIKRIIKMLGLEVYRESDERS